MFRMIRDRRGSAAVEAGFLFPVLLLTTVGLTNLGWDAVVAETTSAAAQSGTDYIAANSYDVSGIAHAVTSASRLGGIAATPIPTTTTGCATASGIGKCVGQQAAGTYAVVTAQATVIPPLNVSGGPLNFPSWPGTLTATFTMRIQ